MKSIPLNHGLFALVDDADFELVSKFRWYAREIGHSKYAGRGTASGRIMYMHRLIMQPGEGVLVDHIDGNGLNNQRFNLRLCSRAENTRNRTKLNSNNQTGFHGVQRTESGKFLARIKVNRVDRRLGSFDTAEAAAMAYQVAARELFGEFSPMVFEKHEKDKTFRHAPHLKRLREKMGGIKESLCE